MDGASDGNRVSGGEPIGSTTSPVGAGRSPCPAHTPFFWVTLTHEDDFGTGTHPPSVARHRLLGRSVGSAPSIGPLSPPLPGASVYRRHISSNDAPAFIPAEARGGFEKRTRPSRLGSQPAQRLPQSRTVLQTSVGRSLRSRRARLASTPRFTELDNGRPGWAVWRKRTKPALRLQHWLGPLGFGTCDWHSRPLGSGPCLTRLTFLPGP